MKFASHLKLLEDQNQVNLATITIIVNPTQHAQESEHQMDNQK